MLDYEQLKERFAKNTNVDRAKQMKKYMRNQFEFYGYQTRKRKALYHRLLLAEKKQDQIDWELLDHCWQDPYREMQYFVCDYLIAMKKKLNFTDISKIERVILNLISNAVKFTNNDGNICVLMDADDNYVTIRVKDDGVGISKDVQEEIFKRFVQEDKSFNRKKEGSGIGLALVKSLVELHDGQVYLESNVEKGSEFVVKLPNVRIENEEENDNKVMDADNKPLVQKIHIEFSDIYELY